MAWRDDLETGDFVIVDRYDTWAVEVVTRSSKLGVWTSLRSGGEKRFMRSWGRAVGRSGAELVQWTPEAEANLVARDERLAAEKAEASQHEAHWRKSRRILQIDWLELPDATLDAVLRLAGQEP